MAAADPGSGSFSPPWRALPGLLLLLLLAGLLLYGRIWEPAQLLLGNGGEPTLLAPGILAAALFLPLLGLLWLGRRRTSERPAAAPRGHGWRWSQHGLVAAAAVAAVCCSLAAALLVFRRIPHVQDSINYLWQARVLAGGQLSLPSHPLADFFTFRFMVNDGRWYSLFQPGWPLLLALGELAGAPWAVSPLLGGLLVLATWGVGRATLGARSARLGVLLLVCSPFFLFMQAEMMAHGAAALLGTAAVWAYLDGQQRRSLARLALAGVLLGLLSCTRALDAVVVAVPLGLHALGRAVRGPTLRSFGGLLVLAGVAAAVASLQLAYNRALTGSAWTWPQDRYFALTEPDPRCHRLGFGPDVGCVREHGPDLGGRGFTPARAVAVTAQRLRSLQTDLWGPGLGLLLAAAGATLGRGGARRRLLAALAAAPLVGYFFYYYHGNCLGARYYYLALPALALLAAAGLRRLAGAAAEEEEPGCPASAPAPRPPRESRPAPGLLLRQAAVVALTCGTLLAALAGEVPRRWRAYADAYWGVHDGLAQLIAEQRLENAVVLIPPSPFGPDLDDRDYRIGFVHARPEIDASPVVIARDLGPANPQLAAWFAGRRFYRYHAWVPPRGRGWLEPIVLDASQPEHQLAFEGESKFPPPRRSGGKLRIRPAPPAPEAGARPAPGEHLLHFSAGAPGEWFELRQHVFAAGDYRVRARLARGPAHGLLQIAIDGVELSPRFDGFANRPLLADWAADRTVHLEPGLHVLRFTVTGSSPASAGLEAGVDRVVLER